MTTGIATLKAFINISNQQSCMEALCLWLISSLLCSVELACIQAGASPLRKAIRWGFHGSNHPLAAAICGAGNAGATSMSVLGGEEANATPSKRSEQGKSGWLIRWVGGSHLLSGTCYLLCSELQLLCCHSPGDRYTAGRLNTQAVSPDK